MSFPEAVVALGEFLLKKDCIINERKARGDKRYANTSCRRKYHAKIVLYRRAVRWLRMCGYSIEDISAGRWWNNR